ncbi:MAG: hypothetical protein HY858_04970 [Candidatus Solibacter usitatus]|nr:hypothetical protein [Candidatus Solibacter usitatus]
MSRHRALLFLQALLIGLAVTAVAQTEHITAFTGAWRLNVAKSRFNPGPPFRSFTLTFAPDGTRKIDLIGAGGQPFKATLPWSDGKEVVVADSGGPEHVTAISTIRGRTFRDTWKESGKVIERVHGVASRDGKTLTITVDGSDGQGRAFHNRLRFEKQ